MVKSGLLKTACLFALFLPLTADAKVSLTFSTCSNFVVKEANVIPSGSDPDYYHYFTYKIEARCAAERYDSGHHQLFTNIPTQIVARYLPDSNDVKTRAEVVVDAKVTSLGHLKFKINYFCVNRSDPWRTGDTCIHQPANAEIISKPDFVDYHITGLHYGPLGHESDSAVNSYISARLASKPWVKFFGDINNYSPQNPDSLSMEFSHSPFSWLQYFDKPGTDSVVLKWERWKDASEGKAGLWQINIGGLPGNAKLGTPVSIAPGQLGPGKWRLTAKYAVGENWPSKQIEFWSGDPTNFSKPKISIAAPANNSIHLDESSQYPDHYPVKFLLKYTGYQHPKKGLGASTSTPSGSTQDGTTSTTGGQPAQADIMLNVMSSQEGWGPFPPVMWEGSLNTPFIKHLPAGYYRIKARRKKGQRQELHYPWTDDWVYFRAGKLEVSQTELLEMQNSNQMSREVPVDLRVLQEKLTMTPQMMQKDSKRHLANIVVDNISVYPSGPSAGKPVNVQITFSNKGQTANDSSYQYKIVCTTLSAGARSSCPLPTKIHTLNKNIDPGMSHTVHLKGSFPSAAGRYRITVDALQARTAGPSPSVVIEVKPTMQPGTRMTVPSTRDTTPAPGGQRTLDR